MATLYWWITPHAVWVLRELKNGSTSQDLREQNVGRRRQGMINTLTNLEKRGMLAYFAIEETYCLSVYGARVLEFIDEAAKVEGLGADSKEEQSRSVQESATC